MAARYRVVVKGRLGDRWKETFSSLELEPGADGTTALRGVAMDQAEVHGVLDRIRDLGLSMVELHVVFPEECTPSSVDEDR